MFLSMSELKAYCYFNDNDDNGGGGNGGDNDNAMRCYHFVILFTNKYRRHFNFYRQYVIEHVCVSVL